MKDTKEDPCLCCPYHFDGYCHNCTHEGCEKEKTEKGDRKMTIIHWVQRGCQFQLYKDFYGKLKIKPMEVCAEPQWITVGSLWKCIKEYFKEIEK